MADQHVKLSRERQQKYLGTVRVQLSQLTQFDDNQPALHPNDNRVKAWKRNFRRSAIKDAINENHINTVVCNQGLDRALQAKGLSRTTLRENCNPFDYVALDFHRGELICLDGRSRVVAALDVPPWDRRWPIDLYRDDISLGLRKLLKGDHVIQAPLSDGEIFLTIEQYRDSGDVESERDWRAYLSETKENNLIRIAGTEVGLLLASLKRIPALWRDGIYLGVLHKIRSLHVNSENVHYLTEIKDFFTRLVSHDDRRMKDLTVEHTNSLQGAAPGMVKDREWEMLLQDDRHLGVFSADERSFILTRRFSIPTLFTYFQDIHILHQCAPVILKLIDKAGLVPNNGSREPDIRSSMRYMFEREVDARLRDNFQIEVSETDSRTVTADSSLRFELAYRQLWLYTIRHILRPDHRRHRKIRFYIDVEGETKMVAAFASKLGFSSKAIQYLISQEGQSRTRVVTCESSSRRYAGKNERYGTPHPETWQWDRQFLFLDHIYAIREESRITTFFVLQSLFYNFFGFPEGFSPIAEKRGKENIDSNMNTKIPSNISSNIPSNVDGNGDVNMVDVMSRDNYSGQSQLPPEANGQNSSLFYEDGTPDPMSSRDRSSAWNDTHHNPNTIDAMDSSDDAGLLFSINGIGKMLDDISTLEFDISRIDADIRKHGGGIVELLDKLRKFGENCADNLQSEEQEQVQYLQYEAEADTLQLQVNARLSGLADSSKILSQLKDELQAMKQELLKPMQYSGTVHAMNKLYARLVDILPEMINHYRRQVDDDMSFTRQIPTRISQCNIAINNVKISYLYHNNRHIFKKCRSIGDHLQQIIVRVERARDNEKWLTELKSKKTEWNNISQMLKRLAKSKADFIKAQRTVITLDMQSRDSIRTRQSRWIEEFHTWPKHGTAFIKNAQSVVQRLGTDVSEILRSQLQAQINRVNLFQQKCNSIIDEKDKAQIQQQLHEMHEALQNDKTLLGQSSLENTVDALEEYRNRINWRNNVLDELQLTLVEEWKRRLNRIFVHVECVVGYLADGNDFGQQLKDAQEKFEKLMNDTDADTQTCDTVLDTARKQAGVVESLVYREVTQLIQGKLMELREATAPPTKERTQSQLSGHCNSIQDRMNQRQDRIWNDIELDAGPDTTEHATIQQLGDDYRTALKAVNDELDSWRNTDFSSSSDDQNALHKETQRMTDSIPTPSRKRKADAEQFTRRSARQMERIQVKFWVRVAPKKWRPILFDVQKRNLASLGAKFTQTGFCLERVKSTGTKDPINLSISSDYIALKDVIGLVAYDGPIDWQSSYGRYLGTMESFLEVKWEPDRPWDVPDDRLDFDLKSLADETDDNIL